MNPIPGVYRIDNTISGRCYIGSTRNLRGRFRQHRKGLRNGRHENPRLRNSCAKYGISPFTFSLIEICKENIVINREQFWIDHLNPEYNIAKIAGSNVGVKHGPMPQSQRDKIGASNLGKKHTLDAKQRMSIVRVGVPKSQIFKDHLSAKMSGRVVTETHRLNLSRALKGKPLFGAALRESRKTHCPAGHEYDSENTSWEGPNHRSRICRKCRRIRQTATYQKKKSMRKIQVQGSGSAVHTITVHDNQTVSCSCPAWRNQSLPPDARTCKHLKAHGFTSDTMVQVEAGEASLPEPPAEKNAPPVLLAHSWDNAQDLTGWWVSEKLDGVRCWWDGEKFISRLGNVYYAPTWFLRQLPKVPLDGELWIGRKKFQETVSVVRKAVPVDEEWGKVLFMVFDLPMHEGTFEERHDAIPERIGTQPNVRRVDQVRCTSLDQIKKELDLVVSQGAEGLMARQPGSRYEAGRSNTLLKLKTFYDAEAVIEGYEPGKGKHKGKVGSLMCVTTWGAHFKVGTGLSDHDRANPPAIGTTITYRYQELSKDQIPRFPSFVAARTYE